MARVRAYPRETAGLRDERIALLLEPFESIYRDGIRVSVLPGTGQSVVLLGAVERLLVAGDRKTLQRTKMS